MPLSKNDIRRRATAFAHEWKDAHNEDADAKSFWDGFLNVFGIPRRRVAVFEQLVKKLDELHGYIDLYWPGKLVVEHKSKGKDLGKAHGQAIGRVAGAPPLYPKTPIFNAQIDPSACILGSFPTFSY